MARQWLGPVIGAALFASAPLNPAVAQPPAPVDHWSNSLVLSTLQSLKSTDIQAVTSEGRPVVTAKTRDGLNVGVYAKACDPSPPGVEAVCHGLEAIISFDPGAKADRRALADQLNHKFALGKFLAEPEGSIRLSRYVVFDGGITPENLRAELASLFAIGVLTGQTLWPDAAKK